MWPDEREKEIKKLRKGIRKDILKWLGKVIIRESKSMTADQIIYTNEDVLARKVDMPEKIKLINCEVKYINTPEDLPFRYERVEEENHRCDYDGIELDDKVWARNPIGIKIKSNHCEGRD